MTRSWDRVINTLNAALSASAPMAASGLDPFDALPTRARDKLLDLRQQAKDAYAILVTLTDERDEVRTERHQVEGHLKRLTMAAGVGGFQLAPDHPRVVAEQTKAEKLETELARLNGLYDARGARWQEIKRLVTVLDAWVSRLGSVALEPYTGPAPKLARAETASDAVERCRRRVRELRADLARVEAAPVPSSMAKEKARAEAARLVEQGRPNVGALIEGAGEIAWPTSAATVSAWRDGRPDPNTPTVRTINPLALAAWLDPAALLARLEAEIDELADDANAMTDEAKAAKRAEILADLLAVEHEEEAFIMQAAAAGIGILRRPDADPRAVLELSGA